MVALLLVVALGHDVVVSAKEPRRPPAAAPKKTKRPAAPVTPAPVAVEPPPPPAPKPVPQPMKLAAPGLSGINVPAPVATFYNEHLAQQMNGWGARVVTAKEIQSLLGFERQKQLLGCGDLDTSCLAELGGALGVDGLVLGDVAKIGSAFQVNVKVVSVNDATSLATYSARVDDETKLLDVFNVAAQKLTQGAATKLNRTLPPPNPELLKSASSAGVVRVYENPYRGSSWIPAATGLIAAGVGGGLLLYSDSIAKDLGDPSGPLIDAGRAQDLRDTGAQSQRLGWVGVGVGAAGLVAGTAMYLYSRELQPEQPSVVVVPSGQGLQLVGVFP